MRVLGQVVGNARSGLWTCHRCLHRRQTPDSQTVTGATKATNLPRVSILQLRLASDKGTVAYLSTSEQPGTPIKISNGLGGKGKLIKKRRLLVLTAIIGAGSIFAFTDTARHSYAAAKRSLRVANALFWSVRELVLPILMPPFLSIVSLIPIV